MEETVGNPETATVEEQQVENKVFGSSDNFFEALEENKVTNTNEHAAQSVGTQRCKARPAGITAERR